MFFYIDSRAGGTVPLPKKGITHTMTDQIENTEPEAPEATASEAGKPKKTAKSKREVLDSARAPQDEWTGAQGFRYTSLSDEFALEVMFNELPEEIVSGLAAFGALTLAGNVTNSVRNGERKGDGPATEKDALSAWLENLKAGNWTTDRGEVEAGVGLLAEAAQRAYAKKGKAIELDAITAKIKELDKAGKAALRKDPAVKLAMLEIQTERAAKKLAEATGEAGEGVGGLGF